MTILIYAEIKEECKHNACSLTKLQMALTQIRHDLNNEIINSNPTIKTSSDDQEVHIDITFLT